MNDNTVDGLHTRSNLLAYSLPILNFSITKPVLSIVPIILQWLDTIHEIQSNWFSSSQYCTMHSILLKSLYALLHIMLSSIIPVGDLHYKYYFCHPLKLCMYSITANFSVLRFHTNHKHAMDTIMYGLLGTTEPWLIRGLTWATSSPQQNFCYIGNVLSVRGAITLWNHLPNTL